MIKLFGVLILLILVSIFSYNEYFNLSKVGVAKTSLPVGPIVKEKTLFRSKCECRKSEEISVDLFSNGNYLIQSRKNKLNITKEEFERLNFTCDLYNEFRRGKSQKVIAYSMLANDSASLNLTKQLSIFIKNVYPEWIIRVYYDGTIGEEAICDVECLKYENKYKYYFDNVDFCNARKMPLRGWLNKTWHAYYMHPIMWKWFPIGDSFVVAFQSRDLQSFITQREVDSTIAWITSDNPGHIMRDHPLHRVEMLGGMWSFFNSRDRHLANYVFNLFTDFDKTFDYDKNLINANDYEQQFLSKHVYRLIKDKSIIHDSYHCAYFNDSKNLAFPSRRTGDCFIGSKNSLECNSTAKFQECPVECRPKEHKDWLAC